MARLILSHLWLPDPSNRRKRVKDLERRGLAKSSIRRKLAAVASLFDHLCEVHAAAKIKV